MWFSIVLAAIIAYIFQTYYNSLRAIFLTRKVTGLPALPIIGSAFYFLNKTSAGTQNKLNKLKKGQYFLNSSFLCQLEIFQIGSGFTEQYGSFFKFWFGAELNVVLQDPKDIEVSDYIDVYGYLKKFSCFCAFSNSAFFEWRSFWAASNISIKPHTTISLNLGLIMGFWRALVTKLSLYSVPRNENMKTFHVLLS